MSSGNQVPENLQELLKQFAEIILHPEGFIYGSAKPGDTIFVQTRNLIFHYAIFVGEVDGVDTVIDNDNYGNRESSIRDKTYNEFAIKGGGVVKIVVYEETLDEATQRRSRAVKEAWRLKNEYSGRNVYDVKKFNCEHFVSLCQGTRWDPMHFEKAKQAMIHWRFIKDAMIPCKSSC